MNYKVVAIDCDGTLINDEQNISKENFEVIKILQSKGIKFIIATGRNDILVKRYVEELSLDTPVIGCNGATIRNVLKNKVYGTHPLTNESVMEVYNYYAKKDHWIRFFTMDTIYTNDASPYNRGAERFYFYNLMKLKEFTNINEIFDSKLEILKALFTSDDEEKLLNMQTKLKRITGIEVFRSSVNCLDIIKEGVSKGSALLEYLKKENIEPKDCIAIGDSENDHSMFENTGLSVAMGNSHDNTKKIVHMVTEDHNNSGVAKALRKIFNL